MADMFVQHTVIQCETAAVNTEKKESKKKIGLQHIKSTQKAKN